jgi:glycerol-3-phosphate dehydrogenase
MASRTGMDAQVAVIGGGVVGCAVVHTLAQFRVEAILLEAERELGMGASGTNSGILHTGFDSAPGELETELILRSAELREAALGQLQVPVVRCGAELRPKGDAERRAVSRLIERAEANGVPVVLYDDDDALGIPGEAVTDPVAYTLALADAARSGGAEIMTGTRMEGIDRKGERLSLSLSGGERLGCRVAVNCGGLHADEVARLAGDQSFEIYPRKGEFFVFDPPGGEPLERILLPVPSERTKGVLVFPTTDGKIVAGPTAHDQTDKEDWSVRLEAADAVLPKAREVLPSLEGAEPIASYAGLRPAGRGVNYLIGPSAECPGLINVAAIRSTGLSASLGIGEYVAKLVADQGIGLGERRVLVSPEPEPGAGASGPWWRRTASEKVGG